MLASSGSDSDETGSPCPPRGSLPAMKRGAGTARIVMSARRLGSMTPLLLPFALDFALGRFDGNDIDSRESSAMDVGTRDSSVMVVVTRDTS